MKKLFLLGFTFFVVFTSTAQVEVKASPIAFFSPRFSLPIGLEYVPSAHWGVTLDVNMAELYYAYITGRHYFNPKLGGDKFYVGVFTGVSRSIESFNVNSASVGAGFLAGYKWVSTKRVIFETGLGLGRNFDSGGLTLPYFQLHLGYRLGDLKKDVE